MKKLMILLSAIFVLFIVAPDNGYSQGARLGKVQTQTIDTLKGAETVAFEAIQMRANYQLTMQVLTAEIGGTSDCKIFVEGSVDGTTYQRITWKEDNRYQFYSTDSANVARQGSEFTTVPDAVGCAVSIKGSDFLYYRWKGTGTANDTVSLAPKYIFKKLE